MEILDPGHRYALDMLDGAIGDQLVLRFVKRIGEKYPGNIEPAYPGTTVQEVIRALIDRLKYVNNQAPCNETNTAIYLLREVILILEIRAKRVKGEYLPLLEYNPETYETCVICGHIFCSSHKD